MFDDDLWLTGTFELDRFSARVVRTAASVPLITDVAVAQLELFEAFTLAVLNPTMNALVPRVSASATGTRLHAT